MIAFFTHNIILVLNKHAFEVFKKNHSFIKKKSFFLQVSETNSVNKFMRDRMQLQIIQNIRSLHSDIVRSWNITVILHILSWYIVIESRNVYHWLCKQGHGCERVVQKAATGAAIPGAVFYHSFFLNRDHR